MDRRQFVQAASAASVLGASAGCASVGGGAGGKVVVVGAGYGGATAAKYIRMWSGGQVEVTLVEPNAAFVSCPISNLVLGGSKQMADITTPYDNLAKRHGVRIIQDRAAAINADKDIGVNATVVNDGTPGSQYRLLLTSRETGTQNAVTNITVDDNADLDAFLGYSGGGSTAGVTVQDATNAELSINGIAVTSQSNTIENVIDGVKLTLNQTTTSAANLALTRDDSAAKKAVQDFVSSYNSLLSTIKTLTAYDTDAQTSSALTGDSLARTVQTRMRDAISGAFDATNGTSLSKIGITTDPKTGQLNIDDTKLTQALSDNLDGVKSLFTSGTGIGSRVDAAATAFTKTDGIFSTTTTGLSKTIEDIKKQYDATSDRIDQRMETYRAQFTQLDTMVSQMNTLSSYLSQQLSALSSSKS